MVWLGVCTKDVFPLVIFESDTLDHDRYIKEVLPVALTYDNDMFGGDWTFQQDGAKAHVHEKSQESYAKNFHSFIDKDHWPLNSPDLYPLDYCVWNEIAQVIKWNTVTFKRTIIVGLKRAVKKISETVVLDQSIISNVPRQRKLPQITKYNIFVENRRANFSRRKSDQKTEN